MSFAQKASLAHKYMGIFNNHVSIMLVIVTIIFILAIIGFFVAHSNVTEWVIMTPAIISIFFLCCLVNLDKPQDDAKVDMDSKIVRYSRQLPYYRHQASIKYKQSLHLKGAKAYCADKHYCYNHHKVEVMKYYLKVHNPQAPWINVKF